MRHCKAAAWLAIKYHNSPECLTIEAPHDIATALTTLSADGSLLHHAWQFCIPYGGWPPEAHPDVRAAWQLAKSTDRITIIASGCTLASLSSMIALAEFAQGKSAATLLLLGR